MDRCKRASKCGIFSVVLSLRVCFSDLLANPTTKYDMTGEIVVLPYKCRQVFCPVFFEHFRCVAYLGGKKAANS
jgi:hypothetical protein